MAGSARVGCGWCPISVRVRAVRRVCHDGSMREVRSPQGTVWECFIEWEGRRPVHRAFRQLREHREARARRQAEVSSDGALDVASGCLEVLSLIDFVAAIATIVGFITLLVILGPWIGFVLFGVVELGIVLVLVAAGFLVRTLLRRPWRVVAVNEIGELWAFRQVGWFASRELVRQVAGQLADGRHPADILPDALEEGSPHRLDPDAPMGLLAKPWARAAAVGFIAVCVVSWIAVLAARG